MSQVTAKDPAETLDYTVKWDRQLIGDEIIATSTWGLTGESSATIGTGAYVPTNTDATTTAWLLGGVAGESVKLTNTMTTDSTPPRIYERTIEVEIKEL